MTLERTLADVCVDCNATVRPTYMVCRNVWDSAKLKDDTPCCLDCLVKRLGRDLCVEDFDWSESGVVNLFLPFVQVKRAVVKTWIRENWPGLKRVNATADIILRTRLRYPRGLTMREVVTWTERTLGVKVE